MKKIELNRSKINEIDLHPIFKQINTEGKWVDGWNIFLNANGGNKYSIILN